VEELRGKPSLVPKFLKLKFTAFLPKAGVCASPNVA
jgi:hypothetical protein